MTFWRALIIAGMAGGFAHTRDAQAWGAITFVALVLWSFSDDPVVPALKQAMREFLEEQRRGR